MVIHTVMPIHTNSRKKLPGSTESLCIDFITHNRRSDDRPESAYFMRVHRESLSQKRSLPRQSPAGPSPSNFETLSWLSEEGVESALVVSYIIANCGSNLHLRDYGKLQIPTEGIGQFHLLWCSAFGIE